MINTSSLRHLEPQQNTALKLAKVQNAGFNYSSAQLLLLPALTKWRRCSQGGCSCDRNDRISKGVRQLLKNFQHSIYLLFVASPRRPA